jgi:hypothetical protein
MMDMRALKVGQHVILSGALPSAGTVGEVTYTGKYVAVAVAAQIEGEDGRYGMTFHNDGNLSRAGGTLTIEERIEKLNTITNAGTAVVGYLDLILHPESEQKIDKDECLRKAFQNAERVLKAGNELRWDVIAERTTDQKTNYDKTNGQ